MKSKANIKAVASSLSNNHSQTVAYSLKSLVLVLLFIMGGSIALSGRENLEPQTNGQPQGERIHLRFSFLRDTHTNEFQPEFFR